MYKKLFESQASDAYEIACIPQIKQYIINVLGYKDSDIYADDGSIRMAPSIMNPTVMNSIRQRNKFSSIDYKKSKPTTVDIKRYHYYNKIEAIVKFHDFIYERIPNADNYSWFIFHTGYLNNCSDILVAHRPIIRPNKLTDQWAIQNIEIKRYASSYLFQPKFECTVSGPNNRLEITGMSHAYLDQFNKNTSKLEKIFLTSIYNDPQYRKMMKRYFNVWTPQEWFKKFMGDAESKNLVTDIQIHNVEDLVKTFYFDAYDMYRQVSVFQIGSGKNARLFNVSGIKSNEQNDPLQLLSGRCNSFSSAFNTILLTLQVRKMGSKYNLYGKIRFSNKQANKVGSFDPSAQLPT